MITNVSTAGMTRDNGYTAVTGPVEALLDEVWREAEQHRDGSVATYIPELRKPRFSISATDRPRPA